jgi:tetratricopeptide (TPR) repeat protein
MKSIVKKSTLLSLLLIIPLVSPLLSAESDQKGGKINWMDKEWRAYDVNADGKFDKQDIELLLADGWQTFSADLNADGAKDVNDVFALYVKLSVLDRNCNEAVSDDDFVPLSPVEFPDADAEKARRIVNEVTATALIDPDAGLPPDVEQKLFASIDDASTLSIAERAYVLQTAGLSALTQRNLKAAQWAFARAAQINDRSANALGSLAFTLAVDKRHEDALILLAQAREIYPKSSATSSSIGWIFARHGQDQESLKYYAEAVIYTPEISKYHMNLGITYLRLGKTPEAYKEFFLASEKDPDDFTATIFKYTVPPKEPPPEKPPVDLEEVKKEYDEQREQMQDEGLTDDELPDPWYKLSQCDQTYKIMEVLENRYTIEMEKLRQAIADAAAAKLNKTITPFMPQWKRCEEDMERYQRGMRIVPKASKEIYATAADDAAHNWQRLRMAWGYELMKYNSFFLKGAVEQGRSEAARNMKALNDLPVKPPNIAKIRSEISKDAMEEAMRHCYYAPMNKAIELIKAEYRPYEVGKANVEILPFGPGIYMAIVNYTLTQEGYCNKKGQSGLTAAEKALPEITVGFDLWLIEFEWNISTGELELNIGQGLIFGATWSPESGFGVQAGVGVDFDFGPVEARAVIMFFFKTDGTIGAKQEGSIGLKGKIRGKETGLSVGGELTFFQVCLLEPS